MTATTIMDKIKRLSDNLYFSPSYISNAGPQYAKTVKSAPTFQYTNYSLDHTNFISKYPLVCILNSIWIKHSSVTIVILLCLDFGQSIYVTYLFRGEVTLKASLPTPKIIQITNPNF